VEPGPRIGDGLTEPGSATTLTLVGRRAFAVDVQALAVPSDGPLRRQIAGLDPRRFHILAAITDGAWKLGLNRSELYASVAGGLRLDDPGADVAVAAALASARLARALPRAAFVGELSLTGSVRPVSGLQQRMAAAAAAGLPAVVLPAQDSPAPLRVPQGLQVVRVGHVRDALEWALKG
jgi:DNA repair protein RadA/Sms